MKYDLIIFDCDGTLVESEVIVEKVISNVLTERGYPMYTPEACHEEFVGSSFQDTSKLINSRHPEISAEQFMQEITRRAADRLETELVALPNAEKLLKELGDFPKCVASNGEPENVKRSLTATGLIKYFKEYELFTYRVVAMPKPEPDLFLYAADIMGGYRADKCLVIEDSVVGATAAIRASMDVLAIVPEARKNAQMIRKGMQKLSVMGIIADLIEIKDFIKS